MNHQIVVLLAYALILFYGPSRTMFCCAAATVVVEVSSTSKLYTLNGANLDALHIIVQDEVLGGAYVSLISVVVTQNFTIEIEGATLENSTFVLQNCSMVTASGVSVIRAASLAPASWRNITISMSQTSMALSSDHNNCSSSSGTGTSHLLHLGDIASTFNSLTLALSNVSIATSRRTLLAYPSSDFNNNNASCENVTTSINLLGNSLSQSRRSTGNVVVYGLLASLSGLNMTLSDVSYRLAQWEVNWASTNSSSSEGSSCSEVALLLNGDPSTTTTTPVDVDGAMLLAGKLTNSVITIQRTSLAASDLVVKSPYYGWSVCSGDKSSAVITGKWSVVAPLLLMQSLNNTVITVTNLSFIVTSTIVTAPFDDSSSSSNEDFVFVGTATARSLLIVSTSIVVVKNTSDDNFQITARISSLYPNINASFLTFTLTNVSISTEATVFSFVNGAIIWVLESSLENSALTAQHVQIKSAPHIMFSGTMYRIHVDDGSSNGSSGAWSRVGYSPLNSSSVCKSLTTFHDQHSANIDLGARSILSPTASDLTSVFVGFVIDFQNCSTVLKLKVSLSDVQLSWSSGTALSNLNATMPSSITNVDDGITPLSLVRMLNALTVTNVQISSVGLSFETPNVDFYNVKQNNNTTCFDLDGGVPSMMFLANGAYLNLVITVSTLLSMTAVSSVMSPSSIEVSGMMFLLYNATLRNSNITFSNIHGGAAGAAFSTSQVVDSYLNLLSMNISHNRWIGSILWLGEKTDAVGFTILLQHILLSTNGNLQLVHIEEATEIILCPSSLIDVNVTVTTAALPAFFPPLVSFPTAIQVANISDDSTALDLTISGFSFVVKDFHPVFALEATEAAMSSNTVMRGVIEFKNVSAFQVQVTVTNTRLWSIISFTNSTLITTSDFDDNSSSNGRSIYIGSFVCSNVNAKNTLIIDSNVAGLTSEFALNNVSLVTPKTDSDSSSSFLEVHFSVAVLRNVVMGDTPDDCTITFNYVKWDTSTCFLFGDGSLDSTSLSLLSNASLSMEAVLVDSFSTPASLMINMNVLQVSVPAFTSETASINNNNSLVALSALHLVNTSVVVDVSAIGINATFTFSESSSTSALTTHLELPTSAFIFIDGASEFGGTLTITVSNVEIYLSPLMFGLFSISGQTSIGSVRATVASTLLFSGWRAGWWESNSIFAIVSVVDGCSTATTGAARVTIQQILFTQINQTFYLQPSLVMPMIYALLWNSSTIGSAISIDIGNIVLRNSAAYFSPNNSPIQLGFAFLNALLPASASSSTALRVNISSNASGVVPYVSMVGLHHRAASQIVNVLVLLNHVTACNAASNDDQSSVCDSAAAANVRGPLIDLQSFIGSVTPLPIRTIVVSLVGMKIYQGSSSSRQPTSLISLSNSVGGTTSTSSAGGKLEINVIDSTMSIKSPLLSYADTVAFGAVVVNILRVSVTSTTLPVFRFTASPIGLSFLFLRSTLLVDYDAGFAGTALHSLIELAGVRSALFNLSVSTFNSSGASVPTLPNAPYLFNMSAAPRGTNFTFDGVNLTNGIRNVFNPLVFNASNRVDISCCRIGRSRWISDTQLRYQAESAHYYAQSFLDPSLHCPLNPKSESQSGPTPTGSHTSTISKTKLSLTSSRTTGTIPPIRTHTEDLSTTHSWTITPPPTPTPTASFTDDTTRTNTSAITITYVTPPKTFTRTSSVSTSASWLVSNTKGTASASIVLSPTKRTSSLSFSNNASTATATSSFQESASITNSRNNASITASESFLSSRSTSYSVDATSSRTVSQTRSNSNTHSISARTKTFQPSPSATLSATYNQTRSIDSTVTHMCSPSKTSTAPTVDATASRSSSLSRSPLIGTVSAGATHSNETSISNSRNASATINSASLSRTISNTPSRTRHSTSLSQTCAQPVVQVSPTTSIYVYDMMKNGFYLNISTSQPLNIHRFPPTRSNTDVATFLTLSWGRVRFAAILEAFVATAILDVADFVSLDTTYPIEIRLQGVLFECPVNAALEPVVTVTAMARPPPLGTAATVATTSAVAGVALPASVVAGAAGGGSMQRAALQLSLTVCEFSLSEPLDAATSPTQLGFGPPQCYYIRGAVIGNMIFMFGITILSVVAVGLRIELGPRPRMNWVRAAGSLALPGWLIIPVSALLQPVSSSAITLLRNPMPDGPYASADMFIGIIGLVWCAGSWGIVMYLMTFGFHAIAVSHFDAEEEQELAKEKAQQAHALATGNASDSDNEATEKKPEKDESDDDEKQLKEADASKNKKRSGGVRYLLEKVAHKKYEWVDTHEGNRFVKRYGPIFDVYCTRRNWFVLVELAMSVLSGIAGGLTPNYEDICGEVQIALTVLCGLYLVAVTAAWPYNSWILTTVQVLNAALAFTWAVAAFFNNVPDLVVSALAAAQVWLMVLCVAAAFLDILLSERVQSMFSKLASVILRRKDENKRLRGVPNVNDFEGDMDSSTVSVVPFEDATKVNGHDRSKKDIHEESAEVNELLWTGGVGTFDDDSQMLSIAKRQPQMRKNSRRSSISSDATILMERELRQKRREHQEDLDRLLSHKLFSLFSRCEEIGDNFDEEEELLRLTTLVECAQLANRIREL